MDNLIFSPTSGRFSSAVTAQARVHFAEPAVDSRRILRVDVTRKESFQMEPFSPSFVPFAYFLLRGSSRASSFPIWSQPFGRCRYRPLPPDSLPRSASEISTVPSPGLYFLSTWTPRTFVELSNPHSICSRPPCSLHHPQLDIM